MIQIGIIGNGFVGKATRVLENEEISVLCYDTNPDLCVPPNTTLEDLSMCDLIFISVPTPMNPNGSVHLKIVQQVVKDIRTTNNNSLLVLRSTVPPGVCEKLGIYFMPEFLTEKNYLQDFIDNPLWIMGLPDSDKDRHPVFMNKITKLINTAHKYHKIKYNHTEFVSSTEAEMIKYFRNTFLSVKVSFCNEIEQFCNTINVDYNKIIDIASSDTRIGTSHTAVPGPDGHRGFGGTCFPKDTNGLLFEMKNNGMKSYILSAAVQRNKQQDRPEKDWEQNTGRAVVGEI